MTAPARRVYLDWNATTPPHPDVVRAMERAARDTWGNPSSVHQTGRRARAVVEQAREALAQVVGGHPRDVIFTSGGTEANNLALAGARALVTSRIEHPSVTRLAEAAAERGVPVAWVDVGPSGRVEPQAVAEALGRGPGGATVAVMAANHETGVIQPIGALADVVHAAGARLHVDAVQALGKLAAHEFAMADSLAVTAHKLRGPKGIGALIWRGSPALVAAVLRGGSQERGLRPGTLDPVAAAGFHAALERVPDGPASYAALGSLRDELERSLSGLAEPNVPSSPRLPHVTSLRVRGWQGDELVAALDLEGVEVSAGSACSAGTAEPSPVLTQMLGSEVARSSIRVSLGDATGAEDLTWAISTLLRVLGARTSPA